MAANLNNRTNASASNNNTDWKASAFLNVYLPSADGRRKIGAIPLKLSKNFDAAIIKRLSDDPESIKAMLGMLQMDFQLVSESDGGAGTTLPF